MCSLNSVELSQSNVKTCGLITETSFQLIDFYHEKTLLHFLEKVLINSGNTKYQNVAIDTACMACSHFRPLTMKYIKA